MIGFLNFGLSLKKGMCYCVQILGLGIVIFCASWQGSITKVMFAATAGIVIVCRFWESVLYIYLIPIQYDAVSPSFFPPNLQPMFLAFLSWESVLKRVFKKTAYSHWLMVFFLFDGVDF